MNVNKNVSEVVDKYFKAMLKAGHFPEIEYHCTPAGEGNFSSEGYNMMEYVTVRSKFMHLVDEQMKNAGLEGIWSRKRSKAFVDEVDALVSKVSKEDVEQHVGRFRTMFG